MRPPQSEVSATALLQLWLGQHRQTAVFLDVDGTLLDIAETPGAVHVPPGLVDALAQLHRRLDGALALISGRPVEELDRLFHPLRLPASGAHGAYWRETGDSPLRRTGKDLPACVRVRLNALACANPGVLAEDKGSSFALHYRAVPERAPLLREALLALLDAPEGAGLRLLGGKRVYEIVVDGVDKAVAVRRLMATAAFAGRCPLFIGDDLTDHPALVLMSGLQGLGLSVGRTLPGASAVFADAAAVRTALITAAGGNHR
ncbi:trehalose-phosphatase [Pseudomonas sp. ZM23]|uniref:Trehalose 6-phosphate phosphatase n=1 Tax=Pseudomonas triclosanedens TaxID=2961893 RepID=A0ABY6ZRR6_9PSED|nr:trehalose-phosphatase [Pseudomonas triclosanedens]MCP8467074.1 trehalose-phosphatase [Pseudomonas triclosanedens]MCP8472777.1 trehalose-phosphatase [Pseudomonas triclosanedens]MCP8478208.1 trehalose-phosphatase [Pseudomonas triclosanedens]WAI47614.1 trehalose-phosphatase [Pseudomonas triclosanedens]